MQATRKDLQHGGGQTRRTIEGISHMTTDMVPFKFKNVIYVQIDFLMSYPISYLEVLPKIPQR